jgi:hypothetical protein
MSVKNRKRRLQSVEPIPSENPPRLVGWIYPFALGSILTGVVVFAATHNATSNAVGVQGESVTVPRTPTGNPRTVAQLLALTDAELEKVDVVELNLAVAREIPGLEKLDVKNTNELLASG